MKSMFDQGRGWRRGGALLALTALLAAGCVGASATVSPSRPQAANSTEPPSRQPQATATAIASPTAAPPSAATSTDLSTVPLAPSGTWKSIRWVSLPAASLLAPPSPEPDPSADPFASSDLQLFGWSRGFVGFSIQSSGEAGIDVLNTEATAYSSDGVHWQSGSVVQQRTKDPLNIRAVYEGPAGLLAVEETTACGDSWVDGLLASSDGITWQPVDIAKAFGKAVIWDVSGGSAGFVAVDTVGHAAWTSRDGRSWRPVKLDTPVFATSRIDAGTAFSAGYVLVGSTQKTGERNCSGPPSAVPPLRVPTAWWSSDGAVWVKAALPGAKDDYRIQMWVQRLDDHTLAAFDYYGTDVAGKDVWTSTDGRTWKPLTQAIPLALFISDYFYCESQACLKTDGRHGIQLEGLNATLENAFGDGMFLSTWTDSGLMALTQSGDQPPYGSGTDWTVGPTGVLVADAGRLWIGLPSSN